ncbi:hypothetical protein J15TS10_08120 [Paenibacillus woosongensis]|uniref:Uncharacterized protein n=1 Tax=Paenibacillus woosongensis TaxID=307580 RepID=A0ABQ4MM00_9BACL|nr:hypothetical protein J15TS10_08120 [Paenibacillus woosongensis]
MKEGSLPLSLLYNHDETISYSVYHCFSRQLRRLRSCQAGEGEHQATAAFPIPALPAVPPNGE